jgi:hypothetical protein
VINWQSVIVNSFWIMGLAILLAAFSYHYWAANEANRRLRDQLNQPAFQQWYWVSFVFIGVGLVGTSQKTWEMAVWAIFTLISIVNTVRGLRNLGQS